MSAHEPDKIRRFNRRTRAARRRRRIRHRLKRAAREQSGEGVRRAKVAAPV